MISCMTIEDRIHRVQQTLQQQKLNGWLLYDYRRMNNLACRFLEIPENALITRRFFYWIPARGEPVKIVHAIENRLLDHLPGHTKPYRTWQEIESHLTTILKGHRKIAMEYSPRNAIPAVSKVDAGTMDLVRDCGVEVVSSADLLQQDISVWTPHQLKTHLAAAEVLDGTVDKVWELISTSLSKKRKLTEHDVQEFILEEFRRHHCVSGDSPICAVNAHSADPHYTATKENAAVIRSGDFILIDLWCKQKLPHAVYADITRVGVAAAKPTVRQQEIFDIVKRARDAATDFVQKRFREKKPTMGCEVDQHCREVIQKAGYGEFFVHRTGHNIGEEDHGSGANVDNFETRDIRQLLPGTCFSIEPGIYLPGEFGVRLEYDVYVHASGEIQVTGGIQNRIITI